MKYIDEKRNRSFKTVLRFFKDSDFRYQKKKSERIRYHDYYEKFYLNYCYFRDHDFIDTKIGEGVDKVVFKLSNSHHKVIKLYKDLDGFEQEKQNYETLLDIGLNNLVPQIDFYDQYTIVEKASRAPFDQIPRILFKIAKERHGFGISDFGIIENKILILDLGGTFLKNVITQNLDELKQINRS